MLSTLFTLIDAEKSLSFNLHEKSNKKYPSGASLKSKILVSGVILTTLLIRSSGLIVIGAWDCLKE